MTLIQDSLQTHFGFTDFRNGQAEAIQSLLSGKQTLVVMPTGAGKSLIFQLAALLLGNDHKPPPTTLVISPLIALMKDQVDSLNQRNIAATYINSSLAAVEQAARLRQLAAGEYRIVYVAPERLRSAQFLDSLHYQSINLLAVDEAHCISEWGHDFRPDYLHIAKARTRLGNPLTVALTATATPQVQKDILHILGLGGSPTCIVTGFNRPNLYLNVCYVSGSKAKLSALKELLSPRKAGATIIYTGTRRDAEEITEFTRIVLRLPAEYYHAGLASEERTRIQEMFMKGKLDLVMATNAFGMGIDRADVRHVVHYSLPGSLEAYYQEAGRAGRDGKPASATLFFDPQDRALHEFFIQQSQLETRDLLAIYKSFPEGEEIFSTMDDLSRQTGLHPVYIKVALSGLEQAGALNHLGDEGVRMVYRRGDWNPDEVAKIILHNKRHLKTRKKQLEDIVRYAEANQCRRKIILRHFGDSDTTKVNDCCDNCRNSQPAPQTTGDVEQMNQGERTGLITLDCVKRQNIKVGIGKLAQILHGSKAADITRFHYDKNIYYGKLAAVKLKDIESIIRQLIGMGYLKVIGGEYPILSLTPRGENAITQKEPIKLKLPKSLEAAAIHRAKAKIGAGGTVEYTQKLFAGGSSPEQIAKERGLTMGTIYAHLAQLISAGKLTVDQVVPCDIREKIELAIKKAGSTRFLGPIKALLPNSIDYNLIRCVIAGREISSTDSIESFITRSHPRPLVGSWQTGWALGFHSGFSGSDWARSSVGELTFRLKYNSDTTVLPELVGLTLDLIKAHPELAAVDILTPVPPSSQRQVDPVLFFCKALAAKLNLPVQSLVAKARQTRPQKEMKTLAQKRANVARAFSLQGVFSNKRILLVDDLFDSGATLEEITRLLIRAGTACVNVFTLTRTIHSDS